MSCHVQFYQHHSCLSNRKCAYRYFHLQLYLLFDLPLYIYLSNFVWMRICHPDPSHTHTPLLLPPLALHLHHHTTAHHTKLHTHTPPLLPPPPALHLHHPPHFHSILPHTQHKGSPLQTFLGRVLFHKIWARMFPSRNSRDRVSNCFFAAASFCLDEWLRWDWRGSVVIV